MVGLLHRAGTVCAVLLLVAKSVTVEAASKSVKISNKDPRRDVKGRIVDCHDGNIVGPINGTYFLYGEWYGNSNFAVAGNSLLPKLSVYTSPNLTSGSWTFRGLLHNNTFPGWANSSVWKWAPKGAWYSPSVVYSESHKKFIIYWTAAAAECCEASWGVAQSNDGVHFDLISLTEKGYFANSSVDGSSLLIDDDGVGYVAYTAIHGVPGRKDHIVSIDRLAPNMFSSSKEQVAIFPDFFVEGVMLFKRLGKYYVIYGSCCCACREGSGAVVFSATKITGPWVRQTRDVNCKVDAPICAGMPDQEVDKIRPLGQLTIPAQGIAISKLPKAGLRGEDVYLWQGMRWLSGEHNPKQCTTLCNPPTGVCTQDPAYHTGEDFDYWIPLEFDSQGNIKQFKEFVDTFELSVESFSEETSEDSFEGNAVVDSPEHEKKSLVYPIYQAHANSHFELGRIIGAKARSRIHLWMKTYAALHKYLLPFSKTSAGKVILDNFHDNICNDESSMKKYCDELKGVANATGVSFETLFILSVRHELTQVMNTNISGHDHVAQDPECTDVLTSSAFAHNEDGAAALLKTAYYVNASVVDPESGSVQTSFFSFFYPASPAGHAFGVSLNGRKMAISMNAVFPKQVNLNGAPVYFLTRAVLDCTMPSEVLKLLRTTESAYGGSLNLGTVSDGVMNIEFGPSALSKSYDVKRNVRLTLPPEDGGAIFHMNEYLYLSGVPFESDPSSERRLAVAKAINSINPVSSTSPASFYRILGDVSDKSYPLWRNSSGKDDLSTAATVLFEFHKSLSMTVYESGNPRDAGTHKVNFTF